MPRLRWLLSLPAIAIVLSSHCAHAVTYIHANGLTDATVGVGQQVILTMDCASGGTVLVVPFLDSDDNGVFGAQTDESTGDGWLFADGAAKDEDATAGRIQVTLIPNGGPYVGRTMLFMAGEVANGTSASCLVTFGQADAEQGVSGTITNSDGSPAAGIAVSAVFLKDYDPWNEGPLGRTVYTVITDSLGNYSMDLPQSGPYSIEAGEGPITRKVSVPSATMVNGCDIHFPPDEMDCNTQSQGTCLVSGTVKDTGNKPLPFVRVTIGSYTTSTDASGQYSMEVQDGDWTAQVFLPGYVQETSYPIHVAGDMTFDMAMHRAQYRIGGVVKDASNSQPVTTARVTVSSASSSYFYADSPSPAGRYLCWADAGTWDLKALARTSYEFSTQSVTLSANKTQDISLIRRSATLNGTITVLDGPVNPWAYIEAVNQSRSFAVNPSAYNNGDGTFSIALTPGDTYQISYLKNGYEGNKYTLTLSANQTFTDNADRTSMDYLSDPPVLSGGQVSPTFGLPATVFTYEVTYTDANNNAPSFVRVNVNPGWHDMVKSNPADNNYVDGVKYVYSTTLSDGLQSFFFAAEQPSVNGVQIRAETALFERFWHPGPCIRHVPQNGFAAPSSGRLFVGTAQGIQCNLGDTDGYKNLSKSYMLINTTQTYSNAIYVMYDQNLNKLYLRNDANTAWLGGHAPGSANIIENSCCRVDCAATTATGAYGWLGLTWNILIKDALGGKTCGVWMRLEDDDGYADGWESMATVEIGYAPQNLSLSPNSGTLGAGTPYTLMCNYFDPDGAANLANCYLLVNTTQSQVNAAFLRYDANANKLYVKNDANTAWLGGYAPGSANVIENSYCKLRCAQTQVLAGATLWIYWALELKPTMGRNCGAWMLVYDDNGRRDGYDQLGTFVVSGLNPRNVSLSPTGGSFAANTKQTFTSVYSDGDGTGTLANCYLLVNNTLNQANAAFVRYDVRANLLYVKNDANTAWLGGSSPGSGAVIENSRCKLYCAETTISGSSSGLTVNWRILLKPMFPARGVNAWALVYDDTGLRDGYDQMGAYTLTQLLPKNVSLSPNTGSFVSNTKLTFASAYSDPDGCGDLANCYLLINNACNQANAAFMRYDANANRLYLKNDANTSWGMGYAPGSANVLENSRCRLYCAETTVSGSETGLTVSWRVLLKPAFAVNSISAWTLVYDDAGLRDGYDKMGTYALSQVAPRNVSLAPNSGALTKGVPFTAVSNYADSDGYADLANCYLLLNANFSQANAAFVRYDSNAGLLYLKNDSDTSWGTGYAPGSAQVLENSRCRLYCADTTVSGSTTNLTVNWRLELKSGISWTACSAWALAYDDLGLRDGYDQMGSFAVQ